MADFGDLVEFETRGLVAAATAMDGDRHRAQDIAETLQATVPSVKSLLYRGRAALRSSPTVQSYAE